MKVNLSDSHIGERTLEGAIAALRKYLTLTQRPDALELLAKAEAKAAGDPDYAQQYRHAFLHGHNLEFRDLFSSFGEYFERPRPEFPFYPHHDAVNAIDSAVHHIRLGHMDYALEAVVRQLRDYLTATNQTDAVDLLAKAEAKAEQDSDYVKEFSRTLLDGSTVDRRQLFSPFGDYNSPPRKTFPPYPHLDAVNAIDSAMLHIREGDTDQAIKDYNLLHNRQ